MNSYADLEEKTRRIGQALYDSVGDEVPAFFDRKRWTGRIMERVMRDEGFKVRLFRFIDLLPALKSDLLIVRMLNEYFSDEKNVPLLIRRGIRRISEGRLMPHVAGSVIKAGAEALARQFIAGSNPEDSVRALDALEREGADVSIDLLGEVVLSDGEAELYSGRYLDLLDFLGNWKRKSGHPVSQAWGHEHSCDISLKISSLYSQLNPLDWDGSKKRAREALSPIFTRAGEMGVSITFDMEHAHLKDLILCIFRETLEEFKEIPVAGVAVQAYLLSAKEDLLDLIGWARKNKRRVTVRLVKGAYWDYEIAVNRQKGWPIPVFLNKEETDYNFEDLTRMILENTDCLRPAIATHNLRSISHGLAVAESLSLPAEAFEFQMLYGMAEPLRKALEKKKCQVRVYTPVGEFLPGMAYLIRRLLENTANESFLRRSFLEKKSFEELIRAPEPADPGTPGRQDNVFRNEPPQDFSLARNRESMSDALKEIRGGFGAMYPLVIGGSAVQTESELSSRNPSAPGEVIGRVSQADRGYADLAVSEGRKKWGTWRDVPSEERAGHLFRAAEIMRKERYSLAALEVCEVGKTWEDADGDVAGAIDYLEYYGRGMLRLGRSLKPGDSPGEENEYCYEPRGVGVVISPWNFPLAIPAGMVSAAIVAGNCVIFKPSGFSPVTGYMLYDIFRRAGLPEGVLQFLPGAGSDIGEHLVSHPGTDFIAFTGSKDVGLKIIELSGRTVPGQRSIKKVIAEMGGKNAIIIDETADLDEAVKGVLESSLGYQGQKCSACSRIIVVEDIYEEFCRRFTEAVESIRIGPSEDPSVFMGPVIDKTALERIEEYTDMGRRQGTTVLLRRVEGEGYFAGPVLFSDLPSGSPLLREEIFGPVLALLRARDFDEALEIALDSLYALTGGLFSRSPRNIGKARQEFRVGNLYINRKITGALVGRQPFGGFGMSGIGSKAGGPDYLLQFMNPRSISENTLRKGFAPKMP